MSYLMITGQPIGIQHVDAAPPEEGVLFVKPDANGKDDCSSWNDACELQAALEVASYGDEIWVASGVYTPTYQTDPPDESSATFEMKPGVALYGGFVGNESDLEQRNWEANFTILSGDLDGNDLTEPSGMITDTANIIGSNAYHVVISNWVTETTILDGIFITGGSGGQGGGMENIGSSPVLNNVTFTGNSAVTGNGGGMYNYDSSPVLNNVTFCGNMTDNYGGGMYNVEYSSPVLTNVTFNDNTAGYSGGGMFNDWYSNTSLKNATFSGNTAGGSGGGLRNVVSSLVLTDVTFSGNSAGDVGGGVDSWISSLVLTNVTFIGNTSYNGGGINNDGGSLVLNNIIFSNNTAEGWGGGMRNSFCNPVLTNVTFSGNTTEDWGGGIFNTNSSPELTNVIFSSNTAGTWGGGMFNAESNPVLTNVTFSGNTAGEQGDALYNYGISYPIITNTILWGNAADDSGQQIYNSVSSSTHISYSDIQGVCDTITGSNICFGEGNIDADPLFVRDPDPGTDGILGTEDDDYGDLRLGPLSPAIDAGDNTAVPAEVTTDLDGNPRFADIPGVADTGSGTAPIVDMGAYEAVNLAPVADDDPDYITDNVTLFVVEAPGVVGNDRDPNLDPLSAEIGESPSKGDLTLNPDGSFEYLPEIEFTGVVTFTYHASDGLLASLPATVTITVEQGQRQVYLPLVSKPAFVVVLGGNLSVFDRYASHIIVGSVQNLYDHTIYDLQLQAEVYEYGELIYQTVFSSTLPATFPDDTNPFELYPNSDAVEDCALSSECIVSVEVLSWKDMKEPEYLPLTVVSTEYAWGGYFGMSEFLGVIRNDNPVPLNNLIVVSQGTFDFVDEVEIVALDYLDPGEATTFTALLWDTYPLYSNYPVWAQGVVVSTEPD